MIELGHVTDRKPPFRYSAFVRVERIGTTSITYDHAVYRVEDDMLMSTAKATLVCIALEERKAVRVPQAFRGQIEAFQGPP